MKTKLPTPQKLPSGMYRCQVMVDGKRVSVVEADPDTAQAKAVALKSGLLQASKRPEALTVGEAIDRYIESKDAVLSPATVFGYRRIRENALPELMHVKLRDLTQERVQRAINTMSKTRSPKTVRNAHGLLSAVLSVYRPDMVLRTTLPQKDVKEVAIPTEEEIALILQGCKGNKAELPIMLAIWLGLRASEIRGLTWSCIKDGRIHINKAIVEGEHGAVLKQPKTVSGDRWIKAPDAILEIINQQPKIDEYIVHMDAKAMYDHFTRLCNKLGIKRYRFHDLRHTSASIAMMLGVPNKYNQQRMGHRTDNMLKNVYTHTIKSREDQYADLLDSYFYQKLHTDLHTDCAQT